MSRKTAAPLSAAMQEAAPVAEKALDVVLRYDVWLSEEERLPAAPLVMDEKTKLPAKDGQGLNLYANVPTALPESLAKRLVKEGKATVYLAD